MDNKKNPSYYMKKIIDDIVFVIENMQKIYQ